MNIYTIELGGGLFPEKWTAKVDRNYMGGLIHHIEFNGQKGGLISDTGYRSEFGTIEEDEVLGLSNYIFTRTGIKNAVIRKEQDENRHN